MTISRDEYFKKFEEHMQKYIPPKKDWTPADEAIFKPKEFYSMPVKEAHELQFKAIKYQFKRHFELNKMYKGFCKDVKITPDDIKKYDDLEKIPLIPGEFYKDYPDGKEFAIWLANIFTGEIPQVKIPGKNPNYDDVINGFNGAGMAVAYSSGTSGRHTFVPRDKRTFDMAEYALAKGAVSMAYPVYDYSMNGYLLMPNPFMTNVFAGKVCGVYYDAISNVKAAINREINTEIIKLSMAGGKGGLKAKLVRRALVKGNRNIVKDIINFLETNDKEKKEIVFAGAPYLLYFAMLQLKEEGKTFDFSDRGAVLTGGGWKVHESKRMSTKDFRKMVHETIGIRPEHCIDLYGMVEGNGWMVNCQEGHYLHIPINYYHAMVLDDEFKPVGFNEWGRFAFMDGTTYSYPGFIITGDKVRMLEECPVCGRPGPVLEPEVSRLAGKEMRGCAEEVRRMISKDMGQ